MKEEIKVIIFTIVLVLFESFCYFICKLSPIDLTIIRSVLDTKIQLIPAFTLFYYLWFIFLFLVPMITYKSNKNHFFKYTSIAIVCIFISSIIFFIFPTTIDRGVNINEVHSNFKFLLQFIYYTDTPNLCCFPSMHCALSFIFMYIALINKNLKIPYKILINLSSIGIILSTLFIKQHVVWDIIAAFLVVIVSIIVESYLPLDEYLKKIFNKIK